MYLHPQFQTDVIKPLRIEELMDQEVQHLSGGELQRVAITMCLGKEADLYLIDEPSAYLDSEQRIIAAKVGQSSHQCQRHIMCSQPLIQCVLGRMLKCRRVCVLQYVSIAMYQLAAAEEFVQAAEHGSMLGRNGT